VKMSNKVLEVSSYIGIGLAFVLLVVLGAFYAPKSLDFTSHWLIFAVTSALVFGFQIQQYWQQVGKLRFWLPILLIFMAHFEFWFRYVIPTLGSPRLLTAFEIFVGEYALVSVVMYVVLSKWTGGQRRNSSNGM
jgi:uncharacterized membrane protein